MKQLIYPIAIAMVLWSSSLRAEGESRWQFQGQTLLTFSTPQPATRLQQLNQRLASLAERLNPRQPWRIDVFPPLRPKPAKLELSVTIRLQEQTLLEVTATDAQEQGFASARDLANTWARSLNAFFSQPSTRDRLLLGLGLPTQMSYRGMVYTLQYEHAADVGRFRTNGQRVGGQVIYWQVPADNRLYEVTRSPIKPGSLEEIYVLNRQRRFVIYRRSPSGT
ncbi:MAG: hypothetical protein HC919_10070 [Oscillatoriales cyanobacterium SM2_2_1]|nr:hypothetical protein [Oscillatoriales cyanobacterium SM2_2_1]